MSKMYLIQNGKRIDAEQDGSFIVDASQGSFTIHKSGIAMCQNGKSIEPESDGTFILNDLNGPFRIDLGQDGCSMKQEIEEIEDIEDIVEEEQEEDQEDEVVEEEVVEEEVEEEAVEEEVEEEEEYDHRTIILREAFDAYDTDKNGTMNTAEIGDLCESLGIYLKKEEVEVIMKLVDVDESGNICKKEFIDLMNTEEMSQWETWLDIEDIEEEEQEDEDFLIRTPSPYTTFYNVKSRLVNWDRTELHDRQGTDI